MGLLAMCVSSLEKSLFRSSTFFFFWFFFFFISSAWTWAAYVFWRLIHCQLFHMQIFSPILRVFFSFCLLEALFKVNKCHYNQHSKLSNLYLWCQKHFNLLAFFICISVFSPFSFAGDVSVSGQAQPFAERQKNGSN